MDSFGARSTLRVGTREFEIFRLDALARAGLPADRLPYSLRILLENLLRTRTASRSRADDIARAGELGSGRRRPSARSPSPRRACCCRTSRACPAWSISRRCATRWPRSAATRRDQPAAAGRAGHRPLGAGRRLRHARGVPRSTRRSSSSATRSATPSCKWGQQALRATSRSCRPSTGIVPSGQPRVPGARGVRRRRRRRRSAECPARLSRHARRHRLAHDHDQRPGRARLGRRRHRGRGGHARPAGLDADPAGRRLPADRQAAGGLHRHRPGAHRHARCCARRAWSASSSSSSAPGLAASAAGRPRDHRQHGPGVRRDLRHLPGRRRDAAPTCAFERPARASTSPWSRPT